MGTCARGYSPCLLQLRRERLAARNGADEERLQLLQRLIAGHRGRSPRNLTRKKKNSGWGRLRKLHFMQRVSREES